MKILVYFLAVYELVAHTIAIPAQPVNALFQVDLATNNQGGCSYAVFLQDILQDSIDLAGIGLQLVADYGNGRAEARRLLDSFFSTSTQLNGNQLNTISAKYTQVQNWIANGGAINGGGRTSIPYLFCHSTWLRRYNMQDQALDNNGNPMQSISGSPVLISQDPRLIAARNDVGQYPYWSSFHRAYLFDRSYGSPSNGYCSVSRNIAATQHLTDPSTITLCPKSFGTRNQGVGLSNLNSAHYVARRSILPNPVPRSTIPESNGEDSDLKKVLPSATTLFHELFHLVLGLPSTCLDQFGTEIYSIFAPSGDQIVGLSYEKAVKNPESFVLAAVAYDYTINSGADSNGNLIEFFSGYVTQG